MGCQVLCSVEHESRSCRQQIATPGCIGEFSEDAFGNVDIIRQQECSERVCARQSVWTAINNRECQIQQDAGIDNRDGFLRNP